MATPTAILGSASLDFTSDGSTTLAKMVASSSTIDFEGAGGADVTVTGVASLDVQTTLQVGGSDVATETYVDGRVNGLAWKNPVRVASSANVADLSSGLASGNSFGGETLGTNDRILLKDQDTASENGIYVVKASGTPDRADDLATGASAHHVSVFVSEGTLEGHQYTCTSDDGSDVVGTDGLVFTRFGAGGSNTAGAGLTDSSGTFSVNVDGTGIEISTDTLQLKDNGVTLAKMADITRGSVIYGATASNTPTLLAVGPTDGGLMIGDGTDVAVAAMSGDVTMTSGGVTTIGALAVETDMIAADAVTSAKIADGAINTAAQIADDLIDSQHLAAGGIDAEHFAAGAVDTTALADNGVTLGKMADITRGNIIYGATASNTPTLLDVGSTDGGLVIGDGTDVAVAAMSGDVTMTNGGVTSIAAGVIVNADVNASAGIVASKIAAGTFAAGTYAFTGSTISDLGAVTTADINGGTIDGATIATSDVTVGASKTLDVSGGTLTTSAAQNAAIVNGVGTDVDIGDNKFRAQTLQADSLNATRVPYSTTDGELTDDAAFNFTQATGTLKATVMQATSDGRVKKNVKTIDPEEGLRVISESRGVKFNWKSNGLPSAGVIAQEAKKLVPELVDVAKGGKDQPEDMHSVNYAGYTGYEIAAIQALVARNDALASRVEALESQVTGRKRKAGAAAGGDDKRR